MNSIAVIAFSGDPITFGHLAIIERGLNIFQKLIVAIGQNPKKKYNFNESERLKMAKATIYKYAKLDPKRVIVTSFEGLLVDFAIENNIPTIIRGIRNTEDFTDEKILYDVNRSQQKGIDTILLMSDNDSIHISSSAIKELQKHQGDIIEYAPLFVKYMLEKKISNQKIIGLTGEIGAGKSHIGERLKKLAFTKLIKISDNSTKSSYLPISTPFIHNIDLDQIGRDILTKLEEPIYVNTRNKIITILGKEIESKNGFIDIKKLGIFEDKEKLDKFNSIMGQPMIFRIRKVIKNLEGIILINSALLAESDMCYFCNNNIIVVKAPLCVRKNRLRKRGYSDEHMENRINAQWSAEKKIELINEKIKKTGYGNIIDFNNSEDKNQDNIQELYEILLRL